MGDILGVPSSADLQNDTEYEPSSVVVQQVIPAGPDDWMVTDSYEWDPANPGVVIAERVQVTHIVAYAWVKTGDGSDALMPLTTSEVGEDMPFAGTYGVRPGRATRAILHNAEGSSMEFFRSGTGKPNLIEFLRNACTCNCPIIARAAGLESAEIKHTEECQDKQRKRLEDKAERKQ